MKRFLFAVTLTIASLLTALDPGLVFAAGSIAPSGGGSYANGQTFTINVRASGATFDSLQGVISVSGPVSIVSFSAGGATWLPGKSPSNGGQFVGITNATSSLTVATIKLRGTKEGSGSVKVTSVRLARSGDEVGTGGGTASFTITRAPSPPGGVEVTSATHPDQSQSYDASTLELAWKDPAPGASGYSVVFDQNPETVPEQKVNLEALTAKYENLKIGTYYFHIRAVNGDGWGPVTHFKVTIKAAVDGGLSAPSIDEISLAENHQNDIDAGTVTGLTLRGKGLPGYTLVLNFTPVIPLDPAKYPAIVIPESGEWSLFVEDPVLAGFYKTSAQGLKEGVLTPLSSVTTFELSVAEGGKIKIISTEDETAVFKQAEAARVAAAQARQKTQVFSLGIGGALLLVLLTWFVIWRRRHSIKSA